MMRTDAPANDGYLPLKALATYSGMSLRTLRGHLSHLVRPLPHYRVGGKILVKRSEFDAWVGQFKPLQNGRGTIDSIVDGLLR
jgi:hypothetical protein